MTSVAIFRWVRVCATWYIYVHCAATRYTPRLNELLAMNKEQVTTAGSAELTPRYVILNALGHTKRQRTAGPLISRYSFGVLCYRLVYLKACGLMLLNVTRSRRKSNHFGVNMFGEYSRENCRFCPQTIFVITRVIWDKTHPPANQTRVCLSRR